MFALFVVKNLSNQLLFFTDPGHYIFTSHVFGELIDWFPIPQLSLWTNHSVYPAGADHVFLHWAFEREFFYTFFNHFFGLGPWFQWYYLASLMITANGAFWILKPGHSTFKAAGVSLAVTFLNFYSIRCFPAHFPYACVHWTVLSILLDYELIRRFFQEKPWTPLLLAAKIFVLCATLGQDPGYIAGYALTSFVLTCLFLAFPIAKLLLQHRAIPLVWKRVCGDQFFSPGNGNRAFIPPALLILASVILLWAYVPLLLQIKAASSLYDIPLRVWVTANPLRIFLPVVPWIGENAMQDFFGDRIDWGYAFRPGLFWVLLASASLWLGRKKWKIAMPFLLLLAMGLSFDAETFPVFHLFPWFKYYRIDYRFGAVLPVLFSIPVLLAPPIQSRFSYALVLALFGLTTWEASTFYTRIINPSTMPDRVPGVYRVPVPGPEFIAAMEIIRSTPGEAIFEWPYCITSTGGHMAFSNQLLGVFSTYAWHEKKMTSTYFGRFDPKMFQHFYNHPLSKLHAPDRPENARKQQRDFTDQEWRVIETIIQSHDYSGLWLYVDLLPGEVLRGFESRFGSPTLTFQLARAGQVVFIPFRDPER